MCGHFSLVQHLNDFWSRKVYVSLMVKNIENSPKDKCLFLIHIPFGSLLFHVALNSTVNLIGFVASLNLLVPICPGALWFMLINCVKLKLPLITLNSVPPCTTVQSKRKGAQWSYLF